MKCVVGNCMQPDDNVKRCYWSAQVGYLRGNHEDHAYLDLCSFHQEMMHSHTVHSYVTGWDPVGE